MKQPKKKACIILLTSLLLISVNTLAQDPNFYIYLCFGQSNMEGQGSIEEEDMTVDERFQVLEAITCSNLNREKGAWYPAIPPLCRCYSGLSPADYFGRTMVAYLPDSIKVGIINVSVAGCKIQLFDKDNYQDYVPTAPSWMMNIINEYGGNPYGRLVEMAKLAQRDGVIKGILLHQGESDTGDRTWPSQVKKIYDNLISDLNLNAGSIPLLAGEVVHEDQNGGCAAMNSIIADLPGTLPNSYVISSVGCSDKEDNIHFNSAGYRKLGMRYADQMLSLLGYDVNLDNFEVIYLEPECATIGDNWEIIKNSAASNGYYAIVSGAESLSEAPTDASSSIYFPFTVSSNTVYRVFGRINNVSPGKDSYWFRMDDGEYEEVDGLTTNKWKWVELQTYELTTGDHTFTIANREQGAKLDKICVSNHLLGPSKKDNKAINDCDPGISTLIDNDNLATNSYSLGRNYPNPFSGITSISFKVPKDSYVSLKVYNMLGVEVAELGGRVFNAGKHTVEFSAENNSNGNYFCTIQTDGYSATRKMILHKE